MRRILMAIIFGASLLWLLAQIQAFLPSEPHFGPPLDRSALTATIAASSTSSDIDQENYVSRLADYGAAPELTNESWLNVDKPLRLADLRGKVVLLDMWTFECINCIHVIPSVRAWHESYSEQGLVIIGNHFPEFSFERDIANIREAIQRLDVPYAVAQDNDGTTWNAYNNRYWPTIYLIDKNGHVRYAHIGEGGYNQTESVIQELLKETYTASDEATPTAPITSLTPISELNVRSAASMDSSVIGSIQPGEAFVIRGEDNGWYRIQFNDGEGYVSGEYVTVSTT